MERKDKLFNVTFIEKLKKYKLKVLLIQIDEAHSQAWPIGLQNVPLPHRCFQDRLDRVNNFVEDHPYVLNDPFILRVDPWTNDFANRFRGWPDEYYLIDSSYKVLAKSEYTSILREEDGVVDVDMICACERHLN